MIFTKQIHFVFNFDVIQKLEDFGYTIETVYIKSQYDKIYKCIVITWE